MMDTFQHISQDRGGREGHRKGIAEDHRMLQTCDSCRENAHTHTHTHWEWKAIPDPRAPAPQDCWPAQEKSAPQSTRWWTESTSSRRHRRLGPRHRFPLPWVPPEAELIPIIPTHRSCASPPPSWCSENPTCVRIVTCHLCDMFVGGRPLGRKALEAVGRIPPRKDLRRGRGTFRSHILHRRR